MRTTFELVEEEVAVRQAQLEILKTRTGQISGLIESIEEFLAAGYRLNPSDWTDHLDAASGKLGESVKYLSEALDSIKRFKVSA